MSAAGRVLCVGLATLDTIHRVPRYPGADDRVVATETVVAGGGPAATAAVALARLGVAVAFAGAVGDDEAGQHVLSGLAAEGVDVSAVAVVTGARTPASTILVGPDGARTIIHTPGTAALEPVHEVARAAAWVHVDHVGYAAVRGSGCRLSVDGGNAIPGLDLTEVELYVPTAGALGGHDLEAAAGAAVASGARAVVVTLGADGSIAMTRDGELVRSPGVAVDVVSTLGAGDVFHGALLARLVRGAPLADALAFANRCAALSCRALDARSAIPREPGA